MLRTGTGGGLKCTREMGCHTRRRFLVAPATSFALRGMAFSLRGTAVSGNTMVSGMADLAGMRRCAAGRGLAVGFGTRRASGFCRATNALGIGVSSPSSVGFPHPEPVTKGTMLVNSRSGSTVCSDTARGLSTPMRCSADVRVGPEYLLRLAAGFGAFVLGIPCITITGCKSHRVGMEKA